MTCHEIQDLVLTDMLDGAVPASQKKAVEDHLKACSACREVLAVARKLEADLKPTPSFQPPAYLWDRIKEEIEGQPVSLWDGIQAWGEEVLAGFRPAFVRGSFAAAMLVLLIVFVPYLSRQGQVRSASNTTEVSPLAYLDDSGEIALETGEAGYGTVAERFL